MQNPQILFSSSDTIDTILQFFFRRFLYEATAEQYGWKVSHALLASNNNGIEQRKIPRVVYGLRDVRPMCASMRRLVLCAKTRNHTCTECNTITTLSLVNALCADYHTWRRSFFFSVERQIVHESTREERLVEFMPVARKPRWLKPSKSSSLA